MRNKILFLTLASASISVRAELPDSFNTPSRNPCSHSDSVCLEHYANTERSKTTTKKIETSVRTMTAEEMRVFTEGIDTEVKQLLLKK